MTNLSQISNVPNHFANGKHVTKNAAGAQKNATIQCTDAKQNSYSKPDYNCHNNFSKLPGHILTDKTTQNNSKLITKIKELQLTESSKFSDRLFEDHKNKLIQLLENETNLKTITCEHNDAGDLFFFLQMLKSENVLTNT